MTYITDFASLKSAVADYLIRDDLTSQIPVFIQLFEAEANRSIRAREMQVRHTASTVAGQAYYAMPSDFLEARMITLQTDPVTVLHYVTPQNMARLHGYSETSLPTHYTTIGTDLKLGPTPDGVYTIELVYWQRVQGLGQTDPDTLAEVTENDLLTSHPDLYLYGTLLQAAPYLFDDARLAQWAQMYMKVAESVMEAERAEQWHASPLTPHVDTWTP